MGGGVDLVEMIRNLRTDLIVAAQGVGEERLRFGIEDVELDLEVTVKRGAEGEGKVKLWVVAEGAGKVTSERATTQRIKLRLKPHFFDEQGREAEVLVADSPSVSGGAAAKGEVLPAQPRRP